MPEKEDILNILKYRLGFIIALAAVAICFTACTPTRSDPTAKTVTNEKMSEEMEKLRIGIQKEAMLPSTFSMSPSTRIPWIMSQ
jgi:hypothetical protein